MVSQHPGVPQGAAQQPGHNWCKRVVVALVVAVAATGTSRGASMLMIIAVVTGLGGMLHVTGCANTNEYRDHQSQAQAGD